MEQISLKALAKINLGLDVLRRREDGYHEVSMIMQTIDLYDDLTMEKTDEPEITIRTNWNFVPVNQDNLVYRAIAMLREEFQIKEGVRVSLQKRIPVAAGLAGGSSDCAAALYGMNRLFQLHLSKEELMERGARLGADVPYCILRGTALAEGIGEKLTVLDPMVECSVVIAKPPISVSTKWVYEHLKLDADMKHPDIKKQVEDIRRGDLEAICADMGNVLQDVTIPEYPVIGTIKDKMMEYGAVGSMMSGSGPTVFGIFTNAGQARKAKAAIKAAGLAKAVYVTKIFNN
ncbi:4-(cytidine 5'-diphospho)-2-C-methyl-D-erythritol kinase [Agathobacter ruminis]|uniref:4-diphosphocytidyl-2-C-methyl-D-erythritol kinase n=1 Tax=Agathobacter ruminis TaxID=1712665 RepID=A0A2G3E513_9FIRM|nr:4-(cytidine 5'-diphospho)-2-C-methyl-D-erythritol kinase [Agathobacter ruminis]MDC7302092.1 4-(cytidine 5'-diphospho)-2-C-methyl-D-erythritol kinase [Agathobacter ruminis]PHU38163.1 4-(cytidine 5'-diphospho)-2-C-methyl-D-erythritol kinase [Agathobacter ruminis]